MNTLTISMAFLMGLTGSLHCAGMCGPIMWVMPFGMLQGFKKWLSIGLYHLGRISMYAVLGLILHSFRSIFNPQWQQYVSIVLGIVLLLAGIMSFIPNSSVRVSMPWAGFVRNRLGGLIARPQPTTLALAGVLNGLLPCGLVYMALSAAVMTPAAPQTVMLMYAFGLGTVPMLLALTVLRSKAVFIRKYSFRKLVPVVMFFFGCLFIVRGMNLGIPYLSPAVSVEHSSIQSTCCHKK